MIIGHGICGLLLRQMEFDADRREIRIAGSAAFESAMLKLATLSAGFADINREMLRMWNNQHRLPDNLPIFLEYLAAKLPEEKRIRIENAVGLTKTGLLDTHPSSADRNRRARLLGEPVDAISEQPARELFENFGDISRLVTLAYYEDDLNVPTTQDFLVPIEQLINPEPTPSASNTSSAIPMMAYDPSAFQGEGR